jgi:hypothetical protein
MIIHITHTHTHTRIYLNEITTKFDLFNTLYLTMNYVLIFPCVLKFPANERFQN